MSFVDLHNWIKTSKNVVVFTGAGMSTESGIPDFRSPNGLWSKIKPIMFEDFIACEATRIKAWRRKFEFHETLDKARPNGAHEVLADLVKRGDIACIITQNVDNLHQDSGVSAAHLIELHGNATYAKCLDCGARYAFAAIRKQMEAQDFAQSPTCAACGGIIKSATISFGQAMPEAEMRRAETASLSCDLFLAIGSSLQVYPAAGLPLAAKQNGARLVIINREETPLDTQADMVIHDDIGLIFAAFNTFND